MCAFDDRVMLKRFHAELAFKESTMSAENSDILTASSPRRSSTDKDNPSRGADESRDGDDGDDDDSRSTPVSAATASVSASSSPSAHRIVDVDMDDDDDDDDEEDEDADVVDNHEGYGPDDDRGKPRRTELLASPKPRLRLNVTLASDPALQPYARDIKLSVSQQAVESSEPPINYTLPSMPTNARSGGGGNEQHLGAMSDDGNAPQTPVIDMPVLTSPESAGPAVEPLGPTGGAADIRPLSQTMGRTPKAPPLTSPPKSASAGLMAFTCEPCGIKFSSLSTLEAHQTYYCSHTRKEPAQAEALDAAAGQKQGGGGRKPAGAGRTGDRWDVAAVPPDGTAKVARSSGRLYACGQCSYSADKKVSLNRHMRMHQSSPVVAAKTTAGAAVDVEAVALALAECYCSDCDIRYSSVKTYRAHKQHYCSARHRDSSAGGQQSAKMGVSPTALNSRSQSPHESATNSSSSPPNSQQQLGIGPQPYLALPTNPIIIIPYSLIRNASVLPGPMSSISPLNIANPEHTCFILSNGLMQPIAQSLTLPLMSPPLLGANNATHRSDGHANVITSPPSPPSSRPKSAASVTSSSTAVQRSPSVTPSTDRNQHQLETASDCSDSVVHVSLSGREVDLHALCPDKTNIPLDLSVRHQPADLSSRVRARSTTTSRSSSRHTPRFGRISTDSAVGQRPESADYTTDISEHAAMHVERIICAPSLPASPTPALSSPAHTAPAAPSPRNALTALSPPAVGCLYGSSHQTYMLRQLLPTDMMTRLVDTGPLDRTAGTFGRRTSTASTRSRRTAANATSANAGAAAVSSGPNAMLGAMGAQIIVKQGVSKCKECNIVFCKYENYLAHKKHYCSARHQQPAQPQQSTALHPDDEQPVASMSQHGDTDRERSPNFATMSATVSGTQQHPPPATYHQVICAACGIKFTSLDNLSAHQMYYCPKRHELQMHAAAAAAASAKPVEAEPPPATGKRSAQLQQQHQQHPAYSTNNHHQNNNNNHHHQQQQQNHHHHHQYRCPLCEVSSPNAGEAKRHLDTHAGVKAFRCSICRYRGNTMRGMRTHIRMHFDRKTASADFNEEDYITCVMEENGIEVVHASHHQQQHAPLQQAARQPPAAGAEDAASIVAHTCEACSYTSTYKGNVILHAQLVHGPVGFVPPPTGSPVLGEGGESLLLGAADANAYSIQFKAERLLERNLHADAAAGDLTSTKTMTATETPATATTTSDRNAKRIKLETMDDETTTSSSSTSTSSSTTTPAYYKQHQHVPLPQSVRRKSVVSLN